MRSRARSLLFDFEVAYEKTTGVDITSLEFLLRLGCNGYFLENAIWTSIFGLAFWDIIFTNVPGAFFNEFQRGPADAFAPSFYRSRREL